jgi:hypothetical protein
LSRPSACCAFSIVRIASGICSPIPGSKKGRSQERPRVACSLW